MACAHPLGGRPARHVANLLDPGDGAVEALQVVFVGGGELTPQARELELDQVTDLTELGQLVADPPLRSADLEPAPEGLRPLSDPVLDRTEPCNSPHVINHRATY